MSAIQLEGLWQYIQTLSLPAKNKKWLAERLLESIQNAPKGKAQEETDYILSSPIMKDILAQGDKQIQSGQFKTTQVAELWN